MPSMLGIGGAPAIGRASEIQTGSVDRLACIATAA